jgi:hypothetical protein
VRRPRNRHHPPRASFREPVPLRLRPRRDTPRLKAPPHVEIAAIHGSFITARRPGPSTVSDSAVCRSTPRKRSNVALLQIGSRRARELPHGLSQAVPPICPAKPGSWTEAEYATDVEDHRPEDHPVITAHRARLASLFATSQACTRRPADGGRSTGRPPGKVQRTVDWELMRGAVRFRRLPPWRTRRRRAVLSDQPTFHLAAVDLVTTSWLNASRLLPPVWRARHTICGRMRPVRRGPRPQALARVRARPSTVRQPPPFALAPRPARSRGERSSAHNEVSGILSQLSRPVVDDGHLA